MADARDVTILATGSEVGLAMDARELLAKDGMQAAVVSMPCWELFAAQPVAYREAVLGSAPRIAVEAGRRIWLGALARRAQESSSAWTASAPPRRPPSSMSTSASRRPRWPKPRKKLVKR